MAFYNTTFTGPISSTNAAPDFSSRPAVAGYEQEVISLTQFTMNPGCARGVTNGGLYGSNLVVYPGTVAGLPGVITVDVTTVWTYGATFGGAYPYAINTLGLAGNNTVFPVYAITDSSNGSTNGIPNNPAYVILTANVPLPAGYDTYDRIGLIYIDGTTFNIVPWAQTGSYEKRNYQLATAVQVLTAGAANVPTLVDLTAGNGPVIPGAPEVKLSALFTPTVATDTASLIATGLTSSGPYPFVIQNSAAAAAQSQVVMSPGDNPVNGNAAVDYLVSGTDTLSLWVSEFTDDMSIVLQ